LVAVTVTFSRALESVESAWGLSWACDAAVAATATAIMVKRNRLLCVMLFSFVDC